MTFAFKLNRFGKVSRDNTIKPHKTYFVNVFNKTYNPDGFSNFIDAQNLLSVSHAFDTATRKSFSKVIAMKGKNIQAMQKVDGKKLKKDNFFKNQYIVEKEVNRK